MNKLIKTAGVVWVVAVSVSVFDFLNERTCGPVRRWRSQSSSVRTHDPRTATAHQGGRCSICDGTSFVVDSTHIAMCVSCLNIAPVSTFIQAGSP
jgi:hypothetical protein